MDGPAVVKLIKRAERLQPAAEEYLASNNLTPDILRHFCECYLVTIQQFKKVVYTTLDDLNLSAAEFDEVNAAIYKPLLTAEEFILGKKNELSQG
jgi:hypothetical protein